MSSIRRLLASLIVCAIVGLSVAVWWLTRTITSERHAIIASRSVERQPVASYTTIAACTLMGQPDVSPLLGNSAKRVGDENPGLSSTDMDVTTCTYVAPLTTASSGVKLASLLVLSARTPAGVTRNQEQFSALPAGAWWVDGYGERAFWNPAFGQLHVLSRNNWLIVTAGSAVPSQRASHDAEKLAARFAPAINE